MSGHLCLKWNNHSSAFLKSISNIQIKERYCDATIACEGKYFPVHRIILSTCSEYFEEIFGRMQCQHPYIVFKDIAATQMELLLNYMYQGEVNVIQEMLPSLIKAAEALKIKGLAVPDDLPSNKEASPGKKRSHSITNDNPQPKRRSEDGRRRRDSTDLNSNNSFIEPMPNNDCDNSSNLSENATLNPIDNTEPTVIKREPLDSSQYTTEASFNDFPTANTSIDSSATSLPEESHAQEEKVFVSYPGAQDSASFMKTEMEDNVQVPFQDQSAGWTDFPSGNLMQNLSDVEMSRQDDVDFNVDVGTSHSDAPLNLVPISDKKVRKLPTFHHCPVCSYKSNKKFNVKTHIKLKHLKLKPFLCTVCPMKFAMKQTLQSHLRIHFKEQIFACDKCDKRLMSAAQLNVHVLKEHMFSEGC